MANEMRTLTLIDETGSTIKYEIVDGKAREQLDNLSSVAESGSYNDLTDKPNIPTVPTNVSAFNNDAGYLTNYTETDPTVPAWAKAANKPTYTASEVGADASGSADAALAEAKSYTDTQIATIPTPDVSGQINTHNTDTGAHSDIRNQIDALQTAVDGKAASSHTHTIANVDGLQTALDGKAASSHTHEIANVNGLQSALDAKAASSHTHEIANVNGLQSALDAKAASSNVYTKSEVDDLVENAGSGSMPYAYGTADLEAGVSTLGDGVLYFVYEIESGDSGSTTSTFTFTIEGTTYTAEEGMTWSEWVASSYNTGGTYYVSGSSIRNNNTPIGILAGEGDYVSSTDTIVVGGSYELA